MESLTEQAFDEGYKAAAKGESSAPAINKWCMDTIAKIGLPNLGNHSLVMDVMQAFHKGYDKHIDEQCQKILESV